MVPFQGTGLYFERGSFEKIESENLVCGLAAFRIGTKPGVGVRAQSVTRSGLSLIRVSG